MIRRKKLARFMDWLYVKSKMFKMAINHSFSARKQLRALNGGYNGSRKEFRDVVVSYWKKFGIRPKKYWYDLYCYKMDKYDPRFIPDYLWFDKILPYYNNILFMRSYTDKNMLDVLYPFVKQPDTVIKNISGIFYDKDMNIIDRNTAIDLCYKEEQLIFKPAIDSGAGRLIEFYDSSKDGREKIDKYLDDFSTGFIVQRIVKQHEDLARIHRDSLNTLRIISFYHNSEVKILSAQLRMGSGNAKIDNYSAGGYACDVKLDGSLSEFAVSKFAEESSLHPSGIAFKDIVVPNYNKVLEAIDLLHKRTPYFNLIGWDFGIDEVGDPVLLEFNVTQGQNQLGSKVPTFLDFTDEVLEDVFINKNLKDKKN